MGIVDGHVMNQLLYKLIAFVVLSVASLASIARI